MTRNSLNWLQAALLAVLTTATPALADEALTLDDVIRLVEAGVGSAVINHKVEKSGLAFEADVDAIIALREAGADDIVVKFLIDQSSQASDRTAARATSLGTPAGTDRRQKARLVPLRGTSAPDESAAPIRTPPVERHEGVRVLRQPNAAGGETLVLTNLDSAGRRLVGNGSAVRGIISSAARAVPETGREVAFGSGAASPVPATVAGLPSSIEVTVRDERGESSDQVDRLTERIEALESGPERPPVGAGFPQHPINDYRGYPIVGYPWGYPILVPFAFEAQEFQTQAYGPFPSFTSAYRAGIDPFKPLAPCQPGVACSVAQRMANP